MRAARILVVDDEPEIRSAIAEILADEGYTVALAADAQTAREEVRGARPDLVLLDIWMDDEDGITLLKEWVAEPSGAPAVVMMSGHGTVDTAIEATRLGALNFIEKPVSLGKLLHVVERALKVHPAHREPLGVAPLFDLLADRLPWKPLMQALRSLVGGDEPVLFVGESGSGRRTLARQLAVRDGRGFSSVSLAAITAPQLHAAMEAVPTPGLLYLGELDEAPTAVQEALLARLTRRDAGSGLRFAAGAGPGVQERLAGGRLRRDVYDRLHAQVIVVPSLCRYREHLPTIIRYSVDRLIAQEGLAFRRFEVAALNRMRRHDWPGNLRELENVIRRLLAVGGNEAVSLAEVDAVLQPVETVGRLGDDLLSLPFREARERFERSYLQAQLELAEGRVAKLAERVGLERTHVYRKLKALGIELPNEEKE